jgi:hypothetical protein
LCSTVGWELLLLLAQTGIQFSREFPGIECRAGLVSESSHFGTKVCGNGIQKFERDVGVHPKLGQAVPMCCNKKKIKDRAVVRFWK